MPSVASAVPIVCVLRTGTAATCIGTRLPLGNLTIHGTPTDFVVSGCTAPG
jgi:hypothetical protein